MKQDQWKKLLTENKFFIEEAADFLNTPNDRGYKVALTLQRKIDGLTAFYRLETDKWFRRFQDPGDGYGLMLRKFKISGAGKKDKISQKYTDYPVLISYLPIEFDHPDQDIPANYEKAKGLLIINTEKTDVDAKEIENFVNKQIAKKTYVP